MMKFILFSAVLLVVNASEDASTSTCSTGGACDSDFDEHSLLAVRSAANVKEQVKAELDIFDWALTFTDCPKLVAWAGNACKQGSRHCTRYPFPNETTPLCAEYEDTLSCREQIRQAGWKAEPVDEWYVGRCLISPFPLGLSEQGSAITHAQGQRSLDAALLGKGGKNDDKKDHSKGSKTTEESHGDSPPHQHEHPGPDAAAHHQPTQSHHHERPQQHEHGRDGHEHARDAHEHHYETAVKEMKEHHHQEHHQRRPEHHPIGHGHEQTEHRHQHSALMQDSLVEQTSEVAQSLDKSVATKTSKKRSGKQSEATMDVFDRNVDFEACPASMAFGEATCNRRSHFCTRPPTESERDSMCAEYVGSSSCKREVNMVGSRIPVVAQWYNKYCMVHSALMERSSHSVVAQSSTFDGALQSKSFDGSATDTTTTASTASTTTRVPEAKKVGSSTTTASTTKVSAKVKDDQHAKVAKESKVKGNQLVVGSKESENTTVSTTQGSIKIKMHADGAGHDKMNEEVGQVEGNHHAEGATEDEDDEEGEEEEEEGDEGDEEDEDDEDKEEKGNQYYHRHEEGKGDHFQSRWQEENGFSGA